VNDSIIALLAPRAMYSGISIQRWGVRRSVIRPNILIS
jgi:hypothetical protein